MPVLVHALASTSSFSASSACASNPSSRGHLEPPNFSLTSSKSSSANTSLIFYVTIYGTITSASIRISGSTSYFVPVAPVPAVRAGGGQLEPLNLSNPRPIGEHCLIKCGSDKPGDDASPDAEMWLNSTPQNGGFS